MADEQETIADIIAEKRRQADEIERDCAEKMKHGEMDSDCYARELVADIRREADRLEAAHRRELAAGGNAAKLREALESIASNLEHRLFARYPSSASDEWMYQKANAALAAPPRNCDKYANHNEAMQAFDAFVREQGKLGFINPYTEGFKWLFALATEPEGETDGSK